MKRSISCVKKMALLTFIMCVMGGAFASSGDGKNICYRKQPQNYAPSSSFTSIKPAIFTLKSNLTYRGSSILSYEKARKNSPYYNSLITYQRGNTTYIMPFRYKLPSNGKIQVLSNLRMINLKLAIHK